MEKSAKSRFILGFGVCRKLRTKYLHFAFFAVESKREGLSVGEAQAEGFC